MLKLPFIKKKQAGFTLIELLIVIAIIVILVALAAVSYTTVQRNARNAQRQSDLSKIATALEEYYADHQEYPTTGTGISNIGQFESAGRDCTNDKICCLLGDPVAIVVFAPPAWKCKSPYNTYINPGNLLGSFNAGSPFSYSGLPRDPFIDRNSFNQVLFKDSYAYGSNGQSYVLATMLYEGKTPDSNAFTNTFDSFYRGRAQAWNGTLNWDSQYAIKSPTH